MAPNNRDMTDALFDKYFRQTPHDPAFAVMQQRINDVTKADGLTLVEQTRQLERLNAELRAYAEAKAGIVGLMRQESAETKAYNQLITESTNKLVQLKGVQETASHAQEQAAMRKDKIQRARGISPTGATQTGPGPTQPPKLANETQEDYIRRLVHADPEDPDPFHSSSEGLQYKEVVQRVLTGNLPPTQLALAPLGRLQKRAEGRRVTDELTGRTFRQQDAIGRTIKGAGLGLGGLYASSTALPFALSQVTGAYNQLAGDDVRVGQAAGYGGEQGVSAGIAGLANRLSFPFQAMGILPQFGGEAQKFGARRRLEAFQAGINPFDALSIGQAEGIQQEVLGRGYIPGSDQEKDVTRGLFRLKNRSSLDPGQALDYIDVVVKRFGQGMDDVEDDLKRFAESAQAAGKSVDQYTKEVTTNINNLVAQGTSLSTAKAASEAFSSFRNIPGDAIASSISGTNPMMMLQAFQANPDMFKSPGDILQYMANPVGSLGAKGSASALRDTIKSTLDGIVSRIPGMENATPEQRAAVAKQTGLLQGMDNLSPEQIAQIYRGGDAFVAGADRSSRFDELNRAFEVSQADNPNRGLTSALGFKAGESNKDRLKNTPGLKDLYDKYFETIKSNPDISKDSQEQIRKALYEEGKSPMEVEKELTGIIRDGRNEDKNISANIMLDASPELKRFIRIIQNSNPSAIDGSTLLTPSERNKNNPQDWTKRTLGLGG